MTAPGTSSSPDAFAQVYDRTIDRVYGLVLGIVGDPSSAARITEEVYLAWWGPAAVLDHPAGAMPQLVTGAHRAAVEHVRSVARDVDADGPSTCPRSCCAGNVVAPASTSTVRDALASLPERQRRVIELAWFGGHPSSEIEGLLGAPASSVSSWMREGVAGLRSATVSTMAGRGDTMGP